jgi:hypothetical protein
MLIKNIITRIGDGKTTPYNLKDYPIFNDDFISSSDKILYNQNGESFNVLDFKELEENTLINPLPSPHNNGWSLKKFSCVKLDKPVQIGDVFYINK